ncbi:uncharacterized protein LOC110707466 [Chenopodium quinoa]|uniref:uncharacterized protein LOC110707466 n=1 Tax=Chenopodium quinoa TaxID=63459 RepID=UPI000B775A3F|nr:uncharacterized protein LOC110707466 [Chenopodium quinoa]
MESRRSKKECQLEEMKARLHECRERKKIEGGETSDGDEERDIKRQITRKIGNATLENQGVEEAPEKQEVVAALGGNVREMAEMVDAPEEDGDADDEESEEEEEDGDDESERSDDDEDDDDDDDGDDGVQQQDPFFGMFPDVDEPGDDADDIPEYVSGSNTDHSSSSASTNSNAYNLSPHNYFNMV